MKYKIIACINHSFALGHDGKLMYHMSNDLKNFKRITIDSVVIMGRKTYESLPNKPLPNRVNIIITSKENYSADGCFVVHSIDECIKLCEDMFSYKDCYIIGGGEIYNQFIERDLIDTMYITNVNDNEEGDSYFPNVLMDNDRWRIFYQSDTQFDRPSKKQYYFTIYKRV